MTKLEEVGLDLRTCAALGVLGLVAACGGPGSGGGWGNGGVGFGSSSGGGSSGTSSGGSGSSSNRGSSGSSSSGGGSGGSGGSSSSGGGSGGSSGSGSSGGGSSGSGSSGGSSGGGSIDPKFACTDGEGSSYTTADDMCKYVLLKRWVYRDDNTELVKTCGSTWPQNFTIDGSLNSSAQAEAERLAGGGSPDGTKWANLFWIGNFSSPPTYTPQPCPDINLESSNLKFSVQDQPGMCIFTSDSSNARAMLFHYNPSDGGPFSTKVGCGAAEAPDGNTVWRVIQLGP